jgi:putative lipoic acid-binding regulatory protein
MGIELTNENSIKQELRMTLVGEPKEELEDFLVQLINKHTKQKVDGKIIQIDISKSSFNQYEINLRLTTEIEDRLKLITMGDD